MNSVKRAGVMFAVAILAAVSTQYPATAQTKVNGYIRIDYQPSSTVVNTVLHSLLASDRLRRDAISEASGLSEEQVKVLETEAPDRLPWIGFRGGSDSRGRVVINPVHLSTGWMVPVSTASEDERTDVQKFIESFCRLLENELRNYETIDAGELERAVSFAEKGVKEAEDDLDRLRVMRERIEQEAGAGLSHEHLQAQLQKLLSDGQQAAIDRHGLEARRKALAEQIAILGEALEDALDDDAVVRELATIVTVRERQLERLEDLTRRGATSNEHLHQAEGELAAARAELEKYRREAVRTAGGDRLGELNGMLTQTVVDLAEAEARWEYIEGQAIPEARLALEATRDIEEITFKIELARQRMAEATARRDDVMRKLRSRRKPRVTFLPT